MGLFTFIKDAGQALGIGDEGEKAKQAESQAALDAVLEKKKAKALVDMVTKVGIKVTDLAVIIAGATATVSGTVGSQEDREKVVLLIGNTRGIETVNDQLKFGTIAPTQAAVAAASTGMPSGPAATPVATPVAPAATLYTVKSGDSLSKIAKEHYGSASKYTVIFEANKPMLADPDKIYPGQVLRIPPQAGA